MQGRVFLLYSWACVAEEPFFCCVGFALHSIFVFRPGPGAARPRETAAP